MNVSDPLYTLSHAATNNGGDFHGLRGVYFYVVTNMVKSSCNVTIHEKDGYPSFSGLFHQASENVFDFMGLSTRDVTMPWTTT